MATDHDDQEHLDGAEGGGALRKKLEAALAENATLTGRLTALEAQNLIQTKGYKLISPEDLSDVSLEELAGKAEALESERAKLGEAALRRSLEARGMSGEELDNTVSTVLGQSDDAAAAAALDRIRSIGSTTGTPPSRQEPDVEPGYDRIRAALRPKK